MKFGWFNFLIIFALGLSVFSLYRIFITSEAERSVPLVNSVQNYVKIKDKEIKVEVADNTYEQARGLSGRPGLAEGEGMLFLFAEEGIYPFWMKDMNFSIDIIWISSAKKIVYIEKNATPESYPKSFINDMPAAYVLEVPAGFSESALLELGDTVEFYSK